MAEKDLSKADAKNKAADAIRKGATKILLERQDDDKTKWTLTVTPAAVQGGSA